MLGRPNRVVRLGRLKSKPPDAPRAGLTLPRHGGSRCAAALRSSDFFSPPCKRLPRWDAARHTKRRHRVKGRDTASGRPDAEGAATSTTHRAHRPRPTANPAALPPQHGETPRLLVTAVELDRTAEQGPDPTAVCSTCGRVSRRSGRPRRPPVREREPQLTRCAGSGGGMARPRREAGEPARSGAGNYRSWARNRPDDEPGWWESRSCKERQPRELGRSER